MKSDRAVTIRVRYEGQGSQGWLLVFESDWDPRLILALASDDDDDKAHDVNSLTEFIADSVRETLNELVADAREQRRSA